MAYPGVNERFLIFVREKITERWQEILDEEGINKNVHIKSISMCGRILDLEHNVKFDALSESARKKISESVNEVYNLAEAKFFNGDSEANE